MTGSSWRCLAAVVGLAWFSLWVWGRSPYARFLEHDALASVSREDAALLGFFLAGWTLMVFAMMLPTSLPLITLFHRMVRERAERLRLVFLLVVGYIAVWAGFGALVHVADLALHQGIYWAPALDTSDRAIGSTILILAGVYQFTPLKRHCLDKCRSPLSFIAGHWHGAAASRQAFRLGFDHGLYCLGCCWSLMLLMFAVGSGNIGWMLALGAIMAVEKNLPWGRRLSSPLGIALFSRRTADRLLPGPLTQSALGAFLIKHTAAARPHRRGPLRWRVLPGGASPPWSRARPSPGSGPR